MRLNEEGKELIKSFEGLRLNAYKVLDSEKYFTIGYGHYGADVAPNMVITKEQANALFDKDIERFENAVNNFRQDLNQNQFNALVSFCYNLGTGILKDFEGMSLNQIAKEMILYVNANGVRLQGLVNRRKKEIEMFNKPVSNQTTDCYKENGVATVLVNGLRVRNAPSLNGEVADYYNKGETFYYDMVFINDGYYWASYISYSGIRRYVASRTIGSKEIYLDCK